MEISAATLKGSQARRRVFIQALVVVLSSSFLLSCPLVNAAEDEDVPSKVDGKTDAKAVEAGKNQSTGNEPANSEPANAATGAKSLTATSSNSKDIALTVYNQNFGLVKDVRSVNLSKGINFLRFEDVAAAIDPTTVNFMSLTAPNTVVVREQNYQYDLLDPTSILAKSVGKEITFRNYSGGVAKELRGILLNSPEVTVVDTNGNPSVRHQGLVVKTDRGVVLTPAGEMELTELPEGLVAKPSLLWKLEATQGGKHDTEISYQTKGLSWRADYVAVSNEDDTKVDVTSWVTLDNKSGATYNKASLKLLAGDVHKVAEPSYLTMPMAEMAVDAAMAPPPQFSEKSFAEYHLYTMAGKTDINDNETKQLSLFNAGDVPSKKLYIYEPVQGVVPYGGWMPQREPDKVNVKLEIVNSEKNNMGMALPKGKVRVYKKDHDGALQFIGEDLLDHTPRDEKFRLYIGDAFDLVGERKQMSFSSSAGSSLRPGNEERASYEISLRNHKDTKVTITAVEHSHGQWKIRESSHPYVKKDSTTFEFTVDVPARGEVKITYEIEVRT
jgi:Uncharacterized conserved protein